MSGLPFISICTCYWKIVITYVRTHQSMDWTRQNSSFQNSKVLEILVSWKLPTDLLQPEKNHVIQLSYHDSRLPCAICFGWLEEVRTRLCRSYPRDRRLRRRRAEVVAGLGTNGLDCAVRELDWNQWLRWDAQSLRDLVAHLIPCEVIGDSTTPIFEAPWAYNHFIATKRNMN